jgi:hypothetical protein
MKSGQRHRHKAQLDGINNDIPKWISSYSARVGQNYCGCGPVIVGREVSPESNCGCGCTLGKPIVDHLVI